MKLEKEEAMRALAPAPSVSRTGKMAELSMSTSSLARSGQASFLTVKRKRPRLGIVVAEVVDATVLDPFGTAVPEADTGRGTELLSSPREHPQLVAKQQALRTTEKQLSFRRSVAPREELPAEDTEKSRREQLALERAERHRRMFIMDEDE
eukprot:RCo030308